jgi:hypothetical protein
MHRRWRPAMLPKPKAAEQPEAAAGAAQGNVKSGAPARAFS